MVLVLALSLVVGACGEVVPSGREKTFATLAEPSSTEERVCVSRGPTRSDFDVRTRAGVLSGSVFCVAPREVCERQPVTCEDLALFESSWPQLVREGLPHELLFAGATRRMTRLLDKRQQYVRQYLVAPVMETDARALVTSFLFGVPASLREEPAVPVSRPARHLPIGLATISWSLDLERPLWVQLDSRLLSVSPLQELPYGLPDSERRDAQRSAEDYLLSR